MSESWNDPTIERYLRARKAITDKHGEGRGVGGEMPCPCCKDGILRYSIAAYNGHIWGKCSTTGCAQWIE